jgi:hypothetical protein
MALVGFEAYPSISNQRTAELIPSLLNTAYFLYRAALPAPRVWVRRPLLAPEFWLLAPPLTSHQSLLTSHAPAHSAVD